MSNVYIDLETIPEQPEEASKALISATIEAPAQIKKPETIAEWHEGTGKYEGVKDAAIEDKYRNTSFNGAKGEIISISWAVEDNEPEVMARGLGGLSEAYMLTAFFAKLESQLNGKPPYFIGHYIGEFDLKFLFHRAVILGIQPPFDLCQWGRHGSQYFDTMVDWAGYKGSISQDNLCKALGIEGKPDDIDGSKVWGFVKAGKIQKVADYNMDDVVKVRKIYKRLKFL